MKNLTCLLLISFLIQGCSGTRYSYRSLVDMNQDTSSIQLQKGDVIELFADGNGFPGSWGYEFWAISSSPEIASVNCKDTRSVIPFREPGIVFGGKVCSLNAHKKGKITLYFGNKYYLNKDNYQEKYLVVVVDSLKS